DAGDPQRPDRGGDADLAGAPDRNCPHAAGTRRVAQSPTGGVERAAAATARHVTGAGACRRRPRADRRTTVRGDTLETAQRPSARDGAGASVRTVRLRKLPAAGAEAMADAGIAAA